MWLCSTVARLPGRLQSLPSHPAQGCGPRPPLLGADALVRCHVQAACWLGSPGGKSYREQRAVSSGYGKKEICFPLLCACARPGDCLWGGQVAPLHSRLQCGKGPSRWQQQRAVDLRGLMLRWLCPGQLVLPTLRGIGSLGRVRPGLSHLVGKGGSSKQHHDVTNHCY